MASILTPSLLDPVDHSMTALDISAWDNDNDNARTLFEIACSASVANDTWEKYDVSTLFTLDCSTSNSNLLNDHDAKALFDLPECSPSGVDSSVLDDFYSDFISFEDNLPYNMEPDLVSRDATSSIRSESATTSGDEQAPVQEQLSADQSGARPPSQLSDDPTQPSACPIALDVPSPKTPTPEMPTTTTASQMPKIPKSDVPTPELPMTALVPVPEMPAAEMPASEVAASDQPESDVPMPVMLASGTAKSETTAPMPASEKTASMPSSTPATDTTTPMTAPDFPTSESPLPSPAASYEPASVIDRSQSPAAMSETCSTNEFTEAEFKLIKTRINEQTLGHNDRSGAERTESKSSQSKLRTRVAPIRTGDSKEEPIPIPDSDHEDGSPDSRKRKRRIPHPCSSVNKRRRPEKNPRLRPSPPSKFCDGKDKHGRLNREGQDQLLVDRIADHARALLDVYEPNGEGQDQLLADGIADHARAILAVYEVLRTGEQDPVEESDDSDESNN